MATARKFALGAVVPAKPNRAKGIGAGQFIVVQKVLDPNKAADLMLLPSKEDADAVAAHVKAGYGDGPTKAAHDDAMENRIPAPALLKFDIRRLQDVSTLWRSMLEAAPAVDRDAPPEPLVGTKVTIELPIFDGGAFVSMHKADCTVRAVVTAGAVYTVSYDYKGEERRVDVRKEQIEAAVAAADDAAEPEPIPVELPGEATRSLAFRLVKNLPVSASLDGADTVDARELVETLKAAGLVESRVDGADANVRDIALRSIAALDSMAKLGDTPGRSWPNLQASRLGAALKSCSVKAAAEASPPKPASAAQHPRVEAMHKLAESEEAWERFLASSVSVTVSNDRHGREVEKSLYMQKGALEDYLRRSGVSGDVETLDSLDGDVSWSAEQLLEYILITCTIHSAGETHGERDKGVTKINFTSPDLTGSSEERRMRLALQQSFESVEKSSEKIAALQKLNSMTDASEATALLMATKAAGEDLRRLVTSELDVEKALQGDTTAR